MLFRAISVSFCLVVSTQAHGQTAMQLEAIRQVQDASSLSSFCAVMQVDQGRAKSYLNWFGLRFEDMSSQGRYAHHVNLFGAEAKEVLSRLSPDNACTLAEMLYGIHGRNVEGLMTFAPERNAELWPGM